MYVCMYVWMPVVQLIVKISRSLSPFPFPVVLITTRISHAVKLANFTATEILLGGQSIATSHNVTCVCVLLSTLS